MDMINALVTGLLLTFSWSTFSVMMIGIVIGFVVGILPGLGGPTAMALMLPFVFKMSAVEAFAFLLGMTAVTATTGDITSVLFGVPGEPTTASTIVDGHAMARNGEAGRALGAVLMSSLVGAIFGAVAIAVAIPIVRPLVLSFGSPEFFMLSLLGISFVAALSGEDVLKGMVSGGIGLMFATIGLDPISGIQRYTFGQLFLWDGIGLVPITIGFYAIPETIELAVLGTSIATQKVEKLGGVMEGVKDTFRHWWLVIRCSALGTFMAIIPGMGAATTQWLAYAHAVQSLEDKSRAGKGAVEGVLGPGAANNSTLGRKFDHDHRLRRSRQCYHGDPSRCVHHPRHRPWAGYADPRTQGPLKPNFFFCLGHHHIQHHHRGDLLSLLGAPGEDNPSPWRYHYSDHSGVDLLGRLCGEERF